MKKLISLQDLAAIYDQKFAGHVKLNLEGFLNHGTYEIKLKSIIVTKELFEVLGFTDDWVTKGRKTVKQPTLREIVISGFEQVNRRLDNVEKRLDNVEKRLDNIEKRLHTIESLPTISRELKELSN